MRPSSQFREGYRTAVECAAQFCELEAAACLSDIVPGDLEGARLAYARYEALLTMAADIRAIASAPWCRGVIPNVRG